MFGIGPMEFLLIAVVAVVFVGPEKLPELLKKFGRFYVQAKRHANDVKGGFDQAIHEAERELELDRIRELQKQIQAATLSDVIDAKHTDKSSEISSDGIHTADGRLINPPPADATSSMMPPDELKQNEASYHEGHLPAHLPKDDHDPFAPSSLHNPALADHEAPQQNKSLYDHGAANEARARADDDAAPMEPPTALPGAAKSTSDKI